MDKLEELYKIKTDFDIAMNIIKTNQNTIKRTIKEKREVLWHRMFDDILKFSKYSNFLDTGYIIKGSGTTLGFEVRDDRVVVISWRHHDSFGIKAEPSRDTYYFIIVKDDPFKPSSYNFSYAMDYVEKVMNDWDNIKTEIEKRLIESMKLQIKKDIENSEKEQERLENQLKQYGGV